MEKPVKVGIGELKITGGDRNLKAYGVGSCIVVICYDEKSSTAGMLHGILPEKPGRKYDNEKKYLDSGIELLVKEMLERGSSIMNLRAKIAGGARMFDMQSDGETIGDRNISKAKEVLAKKEIPVIAEDTGKNYGRTIEYDPATKKATIKSFSHGTVEI